MLINTDVVVYDDQEKIEIAKAYLQGELDKYGGNIDMRSFFDANATKEQKATIGAIVKLTNGGTTQSLEDMLILMENVRGRSNDDAVAADTSVDSLTLDEDMFQLIVNDSQQLWATMYCGSSYGNFLKFTTVNAVAFASAATTVEGACYAIIGIGGKGIQAESKIVEQDYIDAQVAKGNRIYGERNLCETSVQNSAPVSVPIPISDIGATEGTPITTVKSGGRLGSAATRVQNNQIADYLESEGWTITGGGGRMKEEYLPGNQGTKGSNYVDITATKNGQTIRINTVDIYKTGELTIREANAANSINVKTEGSIITIPKGAGIGNLPGLI